MDAEPGQENGIFLDPVVNAGMDETENHLEADQGGHNRQKEDEIDLAVEANLTGF